MGYPVLLLDADDTLFDFAQASAAAFSTLCRTCSLPWSEEHQALYDSISQSLWAQLDLSLIHILHIAIAHGHHAQILLLGLLAGGGELGHSRRAGGLGGLAAGVGVHLSVQHQMCIRDRS